MSFPLFALISPPYLARLLLLCFGRLLLPCGGLLLRLCGSGRQLLCGRGVWLCSRRILLWGTRLLCGSCGDAVDNLAFDVIEESALVGLVARPPPNTRGGRRAVRLLRYLADEGRESESRGEEERCGWNLPVEPYCTTHKHTHHHPPGLHRVGLCGAARVPPCAPALPQPCTCWPLTRGAGTRPAATACATGSASSSPLPSTCRRVTHEEVMS